MSRKLNGSICMQCANHKCKWIQEGKAVDKWSATPTKIINQYLTRTEIIDSYKVYKCPEFKKYKGDIGNEI